MNRLFHFLFAFVILTSSVLAQDLGNLSTDLGDLSGVDIDALSDEQIQQFVDRAEASGYSINQLETLARARGVSSLQIQKLRNRIQQLSTDQPSGAVRQSSRLREELQYGQQETAFDPFEGLSEAPEEAPPESRIFGMSFFRNERLTFEPSLNVPTPKDYELGPGDEVIIDIWGASEQTYIEEVSPEGSIRIPDLGPIYLNGLTVERASSRIKSRLRAIYSTLGSNTFAEVSLGRTRTIRVNVVGEVTAPGTYVVSSFATAFNSLYLAGGPRESGSLRDIRVFRGGKQIAKLDAYDYLISGQGDGIILQNRDVVSVQPYINRVELVGEVKRPGVYEMLDEETVADLLGIAGGFSEAAYRSNLSIERNAGNFRSVVTVPADSFPSEALQNGDKVGVRRISNLFTNRVVLEGAVNQPGNYELTERLTLSALLDLAEGIRPDAFLERAVIIRQKEDLSLTSLTVDLRAVVEGRSDITLSNNDLIAIQSIFDLREDYKVTIQGAVQKPGTYPFVESQTVGDLIFLAGGLTESASSSTIEVARRMEEDVPGVLSQLFRIGIGENLEISPQDRNFVLSPYDIVVVRENPYYERQELVELEGEVVYPGLYAIAASDDRISDVIQRAGGLTDYAYAVGATLIRRTEYFETDEESGDTRSRLRREGLSELLDRDTLVTEDQERIKTQELIGIELGKIMSNPGSKYDLALKGGDVISIPKRLETVRARGEVLYPSNMRYDASFGFKEYISQAGGFTDNARKKKSYVIYANGGAKKTGSFLWWKTYPKVEPGAELVVPKKPERRKISPQEILVIATSLTSMAVLIDNLTR